MDGRATGQGGRGSPLSTRAIGGTTGERVARPLPLVRRGELAPPAVVRALTDAALAARAGDVASRNALYFALAEPIAAQVGRFRRRARYAGAWDLDDVAQEAYLAFVAVIEEWEGDGPFLGFFAARFPFRLTDAVRRLERQSRPKVAWDERLMLHDDSAEAAAGLVQLEAFAARLPEPDASILLWCIRDGERIGTIGRRLGLSPRVVGRRWTAIRRSLRGLLPGSETG